VDKATSSVCKYRNKKDKTRRDGKVKSYVWKNWTTELYTKSYCETICFYSTC